MSGTEAQEPPTAGPELPVPLAELTRSLGRTVKPLENRTEVDIKNILTFKRAREIVTSMQDASIELGVEIEGLDQAVMDISRLLRQLQVAPVKVVSSPDLVDMNILNHIGISPHQARLRKLPPLAVKDEPVVQEIMSNVHTLIKGILTHVPPRDMNTARSIVTTTAITTAVSILNSRHPAEKCAVMKTGVDIGQEVVLTRPDDTAKRVRLNPGQLGCAVFQYAVGPDTTREYVLARAHESIDRGSPPDTQPGEVPLARRVLVIDSKRSPVTGEHQCDDSDFERRIPGVIAQTAATLQAKGLTEAVFCLTNGILWVVGYVARDAGGFRCKHSFVEVIGESLFQPSTTDLEKEHSLQAIVELLVALIDEDVKVDDLFA